MSKLLRFGGQAVLAGLVAFALLNFFPPSRSSVPQQVVIGAESAPREAHPPQNVTSFSGAAKLAIPSVVNVYVVTPSRRVPTPFAEPQEGSGGLGSGVVMSKEGYILTNNHVIEAGGTVAVAIGKGEPLPAKVIGADPETDLAVLKVDASGLQAIAIGDSENVQIGDVVLAIGNPFGVGQTVTQGIVSGTGRNRVGINTFENFIQTDAAINPGNSGGALIDAAGRLIGINTAILSPSGGSLGIGFAIPVRTAVDVMKQIMQEGRVARGWIGIEAQDVALEASSQGRHVGPVGAFVLRVLRGGPADKGGVRPGDVITAVNDNKVADTRDLVDLTAAVAPGSAAQLSVLREGREISVRLEMGRRPPIQLTQKSR